MHKTKISTKTLLKFKAKATENNPKIDVRRYKLQVIILKNCIKSCICIQMWLGEYYLDNLKYFWDWILHVKLGYFP